ncbi:hypothetical protein [Pseudonocardia sp. TMWB2A]|uniref:hypothetical protein n=1 Tax=Pseudonocardia sp. TMWB2A TaxID=687430 RepID=UPI00307DBAE5
MSLDLIILAGSALMAIGIAVINAYGKKHHIGEARFDGETGKQIVDEEDGR